MAIFFEDALGSVLYSNFCIDEGYRNEIIYSKRTSDAIIYKFLHCFWVEAVFRHSTWKLWVSPFLWSQYLFPLFHWCNTLFVCALIRLSTLWNEGLLWLEQRCWKSQPINSKDQYLPTPAPGAVFILLKLRFGFCFLSSHEFSACNIERCICRCRMPRSRANPESEQATGSEASALLLMKRNYRICTWPFC